MSKLFNLLGALLVLLALSGCEGGGGDTTPTAGLTSDEGINLQIYSLATGDQTNRLTTEESGLLQVLVIDADGKPVQDEIVTLNVTIGAASFSNTTDTKQITRLTDNGRITVPVYASLPDNTIDVGQITVSSQNYDSNSITYQFTSATSTTPGEPALNIALALTSTGVATSDIPTSDTGKVTVLLVDGQGQPLPNEIINLTATSGTLSQPSVLTDANGQFSVTLTPPANLTQGTSPGYLTATTASSIAAAKQLTYQFVATSSTAPDDTSSVGSIKFVSATPTVISLKGTGGAGYSEVSQVKFIVSDEFDNPIQGVEVSFTLSTTVGDLSLQDNKTITGADGSAIAYVNSGTIATPVRVTASVTLSDGTPIFVQSDQLTITTGIPDQNSVSLSASKFAPEGLNRDGETVTFTARLADRFNNPVPDGTVVNFQTEGGRIDGTCSTTDSACSVTWTSQNPRPDDHRVTVLATVIGQETYYDKNGSGVFDDGDTFDDLPEAFRDDDESNSFDPDAYNFRTDSAGNYDFSKDEKYIDYDGSATYSVGDGLFNGVPCFHSTDCAPDANNLAGSSSLLTTLNASSLLIMASSTPHIVVRELLSGDSCLDNNGKMKTDGSCSNPGDGIVFGAGTDTRQVWMMVEDTAAKCLDNAGNRVDEVIPDSAACTVAVRQSAPTGSSISVNATAGSVDGNSVPGSVPNRVSYLEFVVSVTSSPDNEKDISGSIALNVTTPSGVKVGTSISAFDPADAPATP